MREAIPMLRRLVGIRAPCLAAQSCSIGEDLILSSAAAAAASYSTRILAAVGARPVFASGRNAAFNPVFVNQNRNFSSPPSSGNATSKPNIHATPKPPLFKNGRNAGRGQGAGVDRLQNSYSPRKFSMNRRTNRKIKKIDLPTHYLEVNYKIGKAIMFYGPSSTRVSMKDVDRLCWSEHQHKRK